MYCNPSEHTGVQAPGFPMIPAPQLLLQHPRPSRVSFHDTRREVRIVSLACLSDELRKDIWYTPSDIDGMRSEARDLCRFLRVNPQACPEEHTRGLELRISLERQCRKQLTVQGVVEAQRRCTDPAFLACLAERCSMVPKEVAIAQAQRDYCTVYVNAPPPPPQDPPGAAAAMPSLNTNNNMGNPQQPNMAPQQLSMAQAMFGGGQQQQQQQQQQQAPAAAAAMQQSSQDDFDCCSLEPIPLSAPDQSMMVFQGNKRMLSLFDDTQDRIVRRRVEGYPAA